jgi:hypothetical protein
LLPLASLVNQSAMFHGAVAELARRQVAGRQHRMYALLNEGQIGEARPMGGAHLQIEVRVPSLAERG